MYNFSAVSHRVKKDLETLPEANLDCERSQSLGAMLLSTALFGLQQLYRPCVRRTEADQEVLDPQAASSPLTWAHHSALSWPRWPLARLLGTGRGLERGRVAGCGLARRCGCYASDGGEIGRKRGFWSTGEEEELIEVEDFASISFYRPSKR